MTTLNQIFALATRTIAVCDHPMLKRANLGFTLNQPFAWSLINTAAVAARMLDEHGFSAEQLESEHVREDILNTTFQIDRYDQLVVKMATLRHFNRKVCGSNEIGMGTINACLRPEQPISLDEIKAQARDRIKIERRMGKIKADRVAARFTELVTNMYQTAEDKKRQNQRLIDEVFFLCNRSDDQLFVGNYEKQMEPHRVLQDIEMADYDQFDYLGEGLAEKLVEPVIRAREELQSLMDRSYRVQTQEHGAALRKELDSLAAALGINFVKIDAQNALIDAELDGAEHVEAQSDAEIDAAIDALNLNLPTEATAPTQHEVIKSSRRIKRDSEEGIAAKQRAEYEAANASRASKSKATRAANASA